MSKRKFPTVEEMDRVANLMKKLYPDTGYCILSFDFGPGGYMHYRTNANPEDLAMAMMEFVDKIILNGETPIPPRTKN